MAFDGTYLKVYEFTEVYFQHDNAGSIAETEFPWPNALKPAQQTETFTWRGGGARKDVTVISAINFTLDLDAIPLAAHATVFGKSEITSAGVKAGGGGDISTAVGFGGGNDRGGVTRGVRAVAHAYAGDTEIAVDVYLWMPITTITVSALPGLNAGGVADKFQYNISCTKTAVDIAGDAITGASSDGEYIIILEAS